MDTLLLSEHEIGDENRFYNIIEPPEILPFGFGATVLNEGDYAQASCVVRTGDLPLKISWSLQGQNMVP